jgi:hypothetical protein
MMQGALKARRVTHAGPGFKQGRVVFMTNTLKVETALAIKATILE